MGVTDAMGFWQLLLVGLVMLLGLSGSLVPGLPGPLLVWAAVFWWAVTEQTPAAWWLTGASTALLVLNRAVQTLLLLRAHRRADIRRRPLLVAGGTATVGFFVLPVVGVVPGFLAGVYLWSRHRFGSHGAAVASTRRVMRAGGWKALTELSACLLVVGSWTGLLLWG